MRKMRSPGSTVDSPANEILVVTQTSHDIKEEEEGKILDRVKQTNDEEKTGPNNDEKPTQNEDQMFKLKDLSKNDLLKLLGIMEGEIQAREDVICLLSSALTSRPMELESRYGSARPTRPLQALKRDSMLNKNHTHHDNVYEKPMAELDRLQDKHRESYRRMLEQLLLAEKSHRHTVHELDTEKRKHVDYMNKSDDFTNLLEQERERLKRLLKQEKAYQMRKEKEFSKRIQRTSGELVKLKSFALMMVDERELHLEKIDKQSNKIQDLLQKLQEKEQKLCKSERKAKEDSQKILDLEVELEVITSRFAKEQEDMAAKLSSQESQHKQLSQEQEELSHKHKELNETNEVLQKSAEELKKLRDKIRKGEFGNSTLMEELETLRKRILLMEGKDEEIATTENNCSELKKKLHAEETHNKELRLEVEKLQQRMTQLEKQEVTFNMGRTEYAQLQAALEKEKSLSKDLTDELVMVKIRMKELESSELKLEKDELDLKEDLMKLKSVTLIMVNEHKNMVDRIRSEEKKKEELKKLYKAEQEKVMEVTERLIEESKKHIKLKSEMELKIAALVKEKDEMKGKLTNSEDKYNDLSSMVGMIKHSTDGIKEDKENKVSNAYVQDEIKVKELTLEIERLKNRLQQLEVLESDLIKSEDKFDMLEKKFPTEQEKANFLSQQVKEIRSPTALSKAVEQSEAGSQEAKLRHRFLLEEAKSRDLQADVQALKEKIHELMNKEDKLSQLQVDYTMLQQRFQEEEDKKKNISNEVLNLTRELEVTKRYSRTLHPCTKGTRIMDVPMTSTGVQTDLIENRTADNDTPAAFIKKSVKEENRIMSSLHPRTLKKSVQRPTVRELYPPTVSDFTVKKSSIPWMKKKDSSASEISLDTSEDAAPTEVNMSPKHGQPMHIQSISDLQNSETTLQISRSSSEDLMKRDAATPSNEIQISRSSSEGLMKRDAATPSNEIQISRSSSEGLMKRDAATPSKEIQKPQLAMIPANERTIEPKKLERALSPVTIATISRLKSPEIVRCPSLDRSLSPVSIVSNRISALSPDSSPETVDMITGRAVFKVTPEKRMVPMPVKKCNSPASIITTEDNKIHIHLGSQFKKHTENHGSVVRIKSTPTSAESKEVSTGTVLRSPHNVTATKSTSNKVTSSIIITQVTKAPARPTLSVPVLDVPSVKSGFTRIPMSRGMKTGKAVLGALGITTGVKMETNAETQAMHIELKKSTLCNGAFQGGGKG
ncbi:filamin-A-interacting protein 1-like isoform X2 [Myxocyprinus asiaticus]|uniref:filamin-A-interacting protein 1-like isoform X2 n=1 Tax=Myxocyprinus asiaticus TaxID=70543 RepID=UPI00222314CC|nr:filamin-A-interacting protein 1-like isoform X2 [Myxocyprinus asiaticus]